MTMTPRLRKFALTAHVTSSVGWLGAVGCFLALAVAGLTSQDAQLARAVYLAMELTTWFVIIPLCLASLLTGLVQSLGTQWGLFRHYWVLVKFLLTIGATILLLVHTKPIGILAGVARETTVFSAYNVGRLQTQLVIDAGLALLVLLVTTTLSVYKPWGMTQYGRRKSVAANGVATTSITHNRRGTPGTDLPDRPDSNNDIDIVTDRRLTTSTLWGRYVLVGIIGLVLLFVILHLAGGGLGHH